MNDISKMLEKDIQQYYGNQYLTYQKNVIHQNSIFIEDQLIINKFIINLKIQGNLIDIGSGNAQWFSSFEKHISKYYAIDINKKALASLPISKKITSVNVNIFDSMFKVNNFVKVKIETAFFSFFLSHLSDESINKLLAKFKSINTFLIVDSLWDNLHKEKYNSKSLKAVRRNISPTEHINLPKRFFEYSDIENIAISAGYKITTFQKSNYWFICLIEKEVF